MSHPLCRKLQRVSSLAVEEANAAFYRAFQFSDFKVSSISWCAEFASAEDLPTHGLLVPCVAASLSDICSSALIEGNARDLGAWGARPVYPSSFRLHCRQGRGEKSEHAVLQHYDSCGDSNMGANFHGRPVTITDDILGDMLCAVAGHGKLGGGPPECQL